MSPIHPITRDDAGIQRLRESNAGRAAGVVTPVRATPVADERPAEVVPAAPRPASRQERRSGDRRRQQRRQSRHAVLLDTRQRQERRRQQRRRENEENSARSAADRGGIDILV